MVVSDVLESSLALTLNSTIPVESSSSEFTDSECPEILASTRDSSEIEISSRVRPDDGIGLPLSSVSERKLVRLMLAEPPSLKD